jgi:hypothetical protein
VKLGDRCLPVCDPFQWKAMYRRLRATSSPGGAPPIQEQDLKLIASRRVSRCPTCSLLAAAIPIEDDWPVDVVNFGR